MYSDFIEKLTELNKCELSSEDDWKFVITTYEDVTKVEYFEKDVNNVMTKKEHFSFEIPSCCDIQVCEKIIEMRKAYKE